MTDSGADLLAGAARALPGPHCALLARLHAFTAERMAAARTCRDRLVKAAARCGCGGPELHAFAREAWEALDGLAREVNVCMHHLFPDLGLYPPTQMTRQCTFYVVRKILHDSPATTHHPVTELLWHETREGGHPAYERLSFLHNLSLFLPIAPVDGRLPGMGDVPPEARSLVRPQPVEAYRLEEGTQAILEWLDGLVQQCYALLAREI